MNYDMKRMLHTALGLFVAAVVLLAVAANLKEPGFLLLLTSNLGSALMVGAAVSLVWAFEKYKV